MYLCEVCDTAFDEPVIYHGIDRMREITRPYTEELCPICGEPYFTKAERCRCGMGYRRKWESLCKPCRLVLLSRVNDFFDTLGVEEAEQFDSWMEADSISNRRNWQ